jgi:hypothetical protein
LKDAFHGSARPEHGLVSVRHRDPGTVVIHPYRGCTSATPRRGSARTSPKWIMKAGGHGISRTAAIILDIDAPWTAIPCWTGRARRWVHETVPLAYQVRYALEVRPAMPNNPVSLKSVVAVAEARASFADHRTGRNCRPTNARLAAMTGLSVRTVQRASTALRLLGVATEVSRGRQRTCDERYASWRVGDRGRGWASVWALHDPRIRSLSPHPGGSKSLKESLFERELTTTHRPKKAGRSAAGRRKCPDPRALVLANSWVHDQQSPPWARRFRTSGPWVHVLTGPARHGWTARDVNALLTDWVGTGHWIPEDPHKPIGLLGAILAAHGDLEDRPAAYDVAREEAELAQRRTRLADQRAEREANHLARQAAVAALSGSGRAAARQALQGVAQRQALRRAREQAAEQRAVAELVELQRRPRRTTGHSA